MFSNHSARSRRSTAYFDMHRSSLFDEETTGLIEKVLRVLRHVNSIRCNTPEVRKCMRTSDDRLPSLFDSILDLDVMLRVSERKTNADELTPCSPYRRTDSS